MMNRKYQILTVILVAVLLAAMVPFALATEEHTHVFEWVWVDNKPPTCTTGAERIHKCKYCVEFDQKETVGPLEHDYQVKSQTAPTCVADGYKVEECTRCGAKKTTVLPKTGIHTFPADYPIPITEADCTTNGEYKRVCSICGAADPVTKKVKALGHLYNYTTTKEPTCSETGTKAGVCARCSAADPAPPAIPSYGGVNQPNGHTFSPWTEKTKGDCKTEIQRSRTCSKCGRVEVEKFGKGKHVVKTSDSKDGKNTYAWFLRTKPSMQGPGRAVQYCAVCGKVIKSKEIKFEGGRYNIPVTAFGPRAANVNGALAGSNDRLIPIDFTNQEPQVFGLITSDGVLVGQIHVKVLDDTVSINYTMNDMETVINQAVFFLYQDAASLTAADLTDMTRAHQFGETLPLNGQTFGVLAARLVINYNSENAANRPFSESGLYLDGVTNNATILQEMTANLLGQ